MTNSETGANPRNSAAEAIGSVWVGSVGIWLPGVADAAAFRAGARGLEALTPEAQTPGGKSIEPRSRRRASRLSRAMADACAEAIRDAKLDASTVATVFGSTLGEAATMIGLLDQMWRGEEMSPMGFATSVHSAASGVVSISSGNRAFTTSLSADFDTVAAALLEAWGLVQTLNTPVIVVCGDDDSPKDFVPEPQSFDLLAVAISLLPANHKFEDGAKPLGKLNWLTDKSGSIIGSETQLRSTYQNLDPVAVTPRVARNPQVGLLDLATAMLSGTSGSVCLDRGKGAGTSINFSANG